jgi:HD-GYP domain-containing protein (c-di-GMP phosphodiesterase class II)
MRRSEDGGLRLAELILALSLATDLGLGQPMEHGLRTCRIALRLGERLGLPESEQATVYYAALLAWVGCTADAHGLTIWFGDDISFRADSYRVDLRGLPMARFFVDHIGAGRPALERARGVGSFLVSGKRAMERHVQAHCDVAGQLALRLGLGQEVVEPLQQAFERWDGSGLPGQKRGEQLALAIRIVHLAEIAEVFHRTGGIELAVAVARERRGTQFDPSLVDRFVAEAGQVLEGLEDGASSEALIQAEPGRRPRLVDEALETALAAIADFADLKSPWTVGHSRGVADLAWGAARRCGLPEADAVELRRAALVHDLGRTGISNAIWDKPGPLSDADLERVRLHPYYTERMLARPPTLARLGEIAGLHHERLDGSGYQRGLSGNSLPPTARILAAADAYHAMTEPRPYRPARSPEQASAELRAEVHAGRLDGLAVDAVLAAAGHRVRRRQAWPAGLTPREVQVLAHLARGTSNRAIARTLVISEKTVGNHVEHIYTKIGVSTRAGASLFAMQHGLLPDPRLTER